MHGFDPTSSTRARPARPDAFVSVDQAARAQDRLVEAATPTGAAADEGPSDSQLAADAADQPVISGRYRSDGEVNLELRVDIDGIRPSQRMSGDFFKKSGGTETYTGSFMVNAPIITLSDGEVVIEGEGIYTFASGSPILRVTIPRPTTASALRATAQFLTSGGVPGAKYVCEYESPRFRTVEFEQDAVEDIRPFKRYDTSKLPSPGPDRVLDLGRAFVEAGIELKRSSDTNLLPISLAGADRLWSDAELHAAMVDHFSNWSAEPNWRVWVLAATRHEEQKYRGLMFDRANGARHQGCAIFHDVIAESGRDGNEVLRGTLRTYVHEIGHCFNLYHPHEKSFMTPPSANRLDALSWMQYPHNYLNPPDCGEQAYWAAFPFQFDDEEIVHLRHGFRNHVIPGGGEFGLGSADVDRELFADLVSNDSGVRLKIKAAPRFLIGAPVVVEIKLELTNLQGRTVNENIHPNFGYVQIGIAPVGGKTMVFRPLITHCAEPSLTDLTEARPAVYDSAYIGYGKDGFYFGSPGDYELRARYNGPDGSVIVSNVIRIRIKSPASREDEQVADLFMGSDQGALLYLLGSDSPSLRGGNEAFEKVVEEYGSHPIAPYASMVQGVNHSRVFKRLERGKVNPRACDRKTGIQEMSRMLEATIKREPEPHALNMAPIESVPRLDNISLNMVTRRLATLRKDDGDESGAEKTALKTLDYFLGRQTLPPHIRRRVVDDMTPFLGEKARAECERKVAQREAGESDDRRG